LACTQMNMAVSEAICASTINGAHSLLLAERKGSIEDGKDADLAVFKVKDHRELAYWFGSNVCESTIVGGEVVKQRC
jgi:imidazolonepropionase